MPCSPSPAPVSTRLARDRGAGPGGRTTADVAAMELGETVCTARSPRCESYPMARLCAWRAAGYPAYEGPAATARCAASFYANCDTVTPPCPPRSSSRCGPTPCSASARLRAFSLTASRTATPTRATAAPLSREIVSARRRDRRAARRTRRRSHRHRCHRSQSRWARGASHDSP